MRGTSATTCSILFLVSLALSRSSSAGVIVVDAYGGAGTQFADLQPAIDAAVDGDILLIRGGTYYVATISNKALTLQADGTVVVVDSYFSNQTALKISDLAAGKRVVLRGLTLLGNFDYFQTYVMANPLEMTDDLGSVWLDSCSISTPNSPFGTAKITNCSDVVITNCDLHGGNGATMGTSVSAPSNVYPALAAVTISSSAVSAHGSTFTGGGGFNPVSNSYWGSIGASPGAEAISIDGSSSVLLTASTATGGHGGNSGTDWSGMFCLAANAGGPGLHSKSGNPTVRSVATTFVTGAAGASATGCLPPPPQPPPTITDTGTLSALLGAPGAFSANSPVRENQNVTLTVSDASGAAVLLLASANATSVFAKGYAGALHVGNPLLVAALGTIPPSGTLITPIVVPNLPPAVLGVTIFTQAATCPSPAPCALTRPAAIVLLDASL